MQAGLLGACTVAQAVTLRQSVSRVLATSQQILDVVLN